MLSLSRIQRDVLLECLGLFQYENSNLTPVPNLGLDPCAGLPKAISRLGLPAEVPEALETSGVV
jgi:hypothetical protein